MIYGKLTERVEFMRQNSAYYYGAPNRPDYRFFPAGTIFAVEGTADRRNFFSVRLVSDAEWICGHVSRTQARLCSPLDALAEAAA